MTYNRLYKSFQKFIDQDEHFTEEQQSHILNSFEHEKSRRIFRLSIILLIWSVTSIFVDSTLIGGGVIFSVMKGINWHFFIPALSFFLINYIVKVTFIRWYMKGGIKKTHSAYCGIPYAGSALIIAFLLKEDTLFLEGLRHYLSYLRKRGFLYLCRFIKSDNKYEH